jgi:hypothetical protein
MPPVVPVIGTNGEPIFFHPHFPQWRSDICKTCKHVIPIRNSSMIIFPQDIIQKIHKKYL